MAKFTDLSYEMVYQNIVSYPYTLKIIEPKYIVREFEVGRGIKTKVVTDMRTKGEIISVISGDSPFFTPVSKLTEYDDSITHISVSANTLIIYDDMTITDYGQTYDNIIIYPDQTLTVEAPPAI